MARIWTSQPGKGLYTAAFLATLPVRIAAFSLYYIPRSFRPHLAWPYKRALGSYLFSILWSFWCTIEYRTNKSLEPGADGERFITIDSGKAELYRGILKDTKVRPTKIGGMWYPRLLDSTADSNKLVVLHFHGGAYVLGGCRPLQGGYAPETLAKTFDGVALAPQYRLAWQENGHFPAPIQDAVSAYGYLLSLGIKHQNIVLSGDSAGGNIALALLRYLEDTSVLPKPRAVCLWSPWVDLRQGSDGLKQSPHHATEWIPAGLPDWGLRDYIPEGTPASHPYISPCQNEFATKVPIFVQTCDQEVLYESNLEFVEGMRKKDAKVECHVMKNFNHDAFALGPVLGATKEAEAAAAAAYNFVKG
ncbi:hypothetical protein MMC10_010540 [Thelotrema lepadinum]|nr:hypothetical protein [Thelotrema lepadinum]